MKVSCQKINLTLFDYKLMTIFPILHLVSIDFLNYMCPELISSILVLFFSFSWLLSLSHFHEHHKVCLFFFYWTSIPSFLTLLPLIVLLLTILLLTVLSLIVLLLTVSLFCLAFLSFLNFSQYNFSPLLGLNYSQLRFCFNIKFQTSFLYYLYLLYCLYLSYWVCYLSPAWSKFD